MAATSTFIEEKSYAPYSLQQGSQNASAAKLFFVGHTGMGDLIALNGLVRYFLLSGRYRLVEVPVPPRYHASVQQLYAPYADVMVTRCEDCDNRVWKMVDERRKDGFVVFLNGGYDRDTWAGALADVQQNFWKAFYKQAGLAWDIAYSHFYLRRDFARENALFSKVMERLQNNSYIVLHEDASRQFIIDRSKIPEQGVEVVPLGRSTLDGSPLLDHGSLNVFDYITLIERSVAFHGYDSSFMWVLEMLNVPVKKYVHDYVRHTVDHIYVQQLQSKWIIVT
jgi:hypothetical protein